MTACTAVVLNLPATLRIQFQNAIIVALSYGETEPEMNLLLERFLNELNCLENAGFDFELQQKNGTVQPVTVKAVVSSIVGDCPGLAKILNMSQGVFGCFFCENCGYKDPEAKCMVYPYSHSRGCCKRSSERRRAALSVLHAEGSATERGKKIGTTNHQTGFKGESGILDLVPIECVSVEVCFLLLFN